MSLRGDLQTMALPDVLQWITAGRKTGTLHVERGSLQKRIIVRDGNIFSSWSNDPRESLGQFLIRLNLVTEEQLFKALLAQEEQNDLLGSILLAEGILTEYDLKRALKAKAEETIYDLFLWPAGQFEFREGEVPVDIRVTYETPVTPVILEGIRRVDERARIEEVFPSSATTFRVTGAEAGHLAAVETRILDLVRDGRTITEMSLEIRRSEYETAVLLYDLHSRGLVEVDETRAEAPPADPVSGHPGPPRSRLPAPPGEALRRRAPGLRGRPGPRPSEPERQEGSDRHPGGPPASAEPTEHRPDEGPGPRRRPGLAHPRDPRPPGGLRPQPGQRRVGRAVDPEALPHGRGGGPADLRAPPGAEDRPPGVSAVAVPQSSRPTTGAI